MSARRVADLAGHDAYALLGVDASATMAQIRRGYRQAMLQAHPDRGGPVERATLITCALELLVEDRANYDEYRRRVAARTEAAGDDFEEDWPEEDTDPWADADTGIGTPGSGADAPGAADHPPGPTYEDDEPADELDDDDRPHRPFVPNRKEHVDPWAWGPLLNIPMVLGAVTLIGVVLAVIANLGNDPEPTFPIAGTRVPITSRTSAYPLDLLNPGPDRTGSSETGAGTAGALPGVPDLTKIYPTVIPTNLLFPRPEHTCTRSPAGRLRCQGKNDDGQLGVGDRREHSGPVTVAGGQTWRAVTRGTNHTCAIRTDRTLWCWGANDLGQLGTGGGKQDVTRPHAVNPGWRWRSVAATRDVTCAVRSTGSLWCWGSSFLARPDLPSGRVPHRYRLGSTWTSVHADGEYSLCAERPGHAKTCLT